MRVTRISSIGLVVFAIALGSNAAGTASGRMTVGPKTATLAHALAIDAGPNILVIVTENVVPREKVKSEMDMMKYNFEAKPAGVILWLDRGGHKLTRADYWLDQSQVNVSGELEATVSSPSEGTFSGTVKSKATATKLKLDATFTASTKP
jgi:hypothetical protein